MSNARVLVIRFLAYPERIIWVSATPVSIVDLNFKPPSWLGWIKLLDIVWNWRHSPIIFFDKFPNSIEKNDWLIWLGRVKHSLVRLGDDNCCRSFEMSWPMSQLYAGIRNVNELANTIFVSDNWLDMAPYKFVWAWCQQIVTFFDCIDNFVPGKWLLLNCRFIWNFI